MCEKIRRTRTVSVRFSDAEYEALCWLCDDHGAESLAKLIRALVADTVEAREANDNPATSRQLEGKLERLHGWLLGKTGRPEVGQA